MITFHFVVLKTNCSGIGAYRLEVHTAFPLWQRNVLNVKIPSFTKKRKLMIDVIFFSLKISAVHYFSFWQYELYCSQIQKLQNNQFLCKFYFVSTWFTEILGLVIVDW